MTSKPADDLKALAAAKKAAAALTEHEQELRKRHAERASERQNVQLALRPRDEVLANASRLVDEAAAQWAKDFGHTVTQELSGYIEVDTDRRGNIVERVRRPRLLYMPADRIDFAMLCALAPDALKGTLRSIVQAQSPATFGLSDTARAERLAVLDAEIAEIERLHSELVDGAAEVGIALSLLPAVAERRHEAAQRAAREAELAAERAAGIHRVMP